MNFQTAITTCLNKYATFTGRAKRPEFWWFVLFIFLVQLVTTIFDSLLFGDGSQPISVLASLALLLPNLAVGARRLRDMGRSAWWLFLGLIPIIGALVLIFWWIQPSKD